MKKIKKIQANGFYIFQGEAAANSNFIETLDEAKKFLIYANFFLRDYLTVYEYNITRHEWHMVVKLKSELDIGGKNEEVNDLKDGESRVWRIVSERMRLFLSRYVLTVNRMRGRTGTLVHSTYERYYFETLGEAREVLAKMRAQTFRYYRRKRKYRGLKKHYSIAENLGKGSIFLCSKEITQAAKKVWNFVEKQQSCGLSKLVLLNMIESTKKLHNPISKPNFIPKIE